MSGRAGPTAAAPTHWTADTGAMVFSATKGMASTVIHRLVDRGLIDYDAPVAEYWPEFGANGKATITVREVMRHRAGLSHLNGASKADLMDHRAMEERLAAAPVNRVLYGKPRLPRADVRLADVRAGPGGHRQGHARSDPRGAGRAAQHRRPAPGPAARRGADEGRADHHPAGHVSRTRCSVPSRRGSPRCSWSAGLRRAVLPRDDLRCAGRYAVPGRRDARGQRSRPPRAAWRRCTRRSPTAGRIDGSAVPVRRAGGRPDRHAEPAAGPKHHLPDGIPPRLPLASRSPA